jgi:uncharacterized membrane protein
MFVALVLIAIPILSIGFLHLVFMIEERLTDESYL